ncbi:MAG: hypothetical protein KDD82_19750 [Planctomycetes bacterium]|nr:hypothetical protein [Planctomycetota bacterium]
MSLLNKIKAMFSRNALPEETRLLLSGVDDVDALRRGLDEIATRNEVEAREIEREIDKLATNEGGLKERVAEGVLNDREKLSVLREIQRLRRRMDSLEKRHRIHQDNIDLHLGLFDRISEMQAMELKRVTQGQIEEIAVDYEERLDKHKDIMNSARAAEGLEPNYADTTERRELAALEAEILSEAGVVPEPKEPKQKAPKPVVVEPEPAVEAEPVAEEPVAEEPVAKEPPAEEPVEAAPARPPLEEAIQNLEVQREPPERVRELE